MTTLTTKEQLKKDNYLCTLANGREIYKGDSVYRIKLRKDGIATGIRRDYDNNLFLCFEDGGEAWISGHVKRTQQVR